MVRDAGVQARRARRGSRCASAEQRSRAVEARRVIACSSASGLSVERDRDRAAATTCSRNSSQRAIASSTGVGPKHGRRSRASRGSRSSSRSSPARRALLGRLRPGRVGVARRGPPVQATCRAQRTRRGSGRARRVAGEHLERRVGDRARRLDPPPGSASSAHELALDARARRAGAASPARARRSRSSSTRVGVGEPAGLEQRGAERRQQLARAASPAPRARRRARAARAPAAGSPRASARAGGARQPRGAPRRRSRASPRLPSSRGSRCASLEVVADDLVAALGPRVRASRRGARAARRAAAWAGRR